jgi:hypothetical protein
MDTWLGCGGGGEGVPSIFIGYVQPRNILQCIHWLRVTEKYITIYSSVSFIFFGTEEYNVIYSLTLYFSVSSSVN